MADSVDATVCISCVFSYVCFIRETITVSSCTAQASAYHPYACDSDWILDVTEYLLVKVYHNGVIMKISEHRLTHYIPRALRADVKSG